MGTSKWVKRLAEIHPITGDFIKSNTDAWYNARRGRLTASKRAEQIFHGLYWNELAKEVSDELAPSWTRKHIDSVAMKWGRDNESRALATLELETGLEITDPGLIFHPSLPFVACTPDGVAEQGPRLISIQIKCPYNPQRHLDNVYGGGKIKSQYWYQVQWEAWLLGADDIVFASYDPRQPLKTQLGIIQIPVCLDTQRTFEENAVRFASLFETGDFQPVGRLVVESGIPEVF